MNKKKEIQRRYGSNMSDAQYLAVGSALDDLQEHIIDKACEWLEDIDYVMQYQYSEDGCTFFNKDKFIIDFRKAMEE